MKKDKFLFTFICSVSLIIFVWCAFLLKCEILTAMHEKNFTRKDVIALLGDEQICKVIEYSENEAKVYYVSTQKTMGNLLTFIREDCVWRIKNWNTIWSKDGNADNIIWPYWWHFIYSH